MMIFVGFVLKILALAIKLSKILSKKIYCQSLVVIDYVVKKLIYLMSKENRLVSK